MAFNRRLDGGGVHFKNLRFQCVINIWFGEFNSSLTLRKIQPDSNRYIPNYFLIPSKINVSKIEAIIRTPISSLLSNVLAKRNKTYMEIEAKA